MIGEDGYQKTAYALTGECGTTRVGEAAIDNGAKTFPAVTFNVSGTYEGTKTGV